jgi:hypothetical protein
MWKSLKKLHAFLPAWTEWIKIIGGNNGKYKHIMNAILNENY